MVEVGGGLRRLRAGHGDGLRRGGSAAFLRFAAGATAAALRAPRPDVVLATSPPLTMALPAIAAARRHRAPLVFEVRDLWPEAPIQMGALRNPLARRAWRATGAAVYRASAHVVALSPGIRRGRRRRGRAPRDGDADPQRLATSTSSPPTSTPATCASGSGSGIASLLLLRHDGRGQRPRPGGRGRRAAARPGRERRGVRAPGRRQAPGGDRGGGPPPGAAQRGAAPRRRQGVRRAAGRGVGRVHDDLQGRARSWPPTPRTSCSTPSRRAGRRS